MAGIELLRKIQLGRESSMGTAVAATAIWRGLGVPEDLRTMNFVKETIGYLSGTDRSNVSQLLAGFDFEASPATFEQIFHVLEAGIMTVGTGSADGGGTGKIYTYNIPETTQPTIKTYTIEGQDNESVEEMEYSYVDNFTLEGRQGEPWMLSAAWRGRQLTVSSFTGALTAPTVEDMLFSKTKLYIDAVGSNYGTTQKSATLLEASLSYKTGLVPLFFGDGNLYFTSHKCVGPEVLLDIIFEHDSTSVAEKANWRSQTARLIQLKCEGSALGTPGTTYSFKTFIVNLAGKWEKFDKLGVQNGNDVISGRFRARYNATKADIGSLIVVNEVASVP